MSTHPECPSCPVRRLEGLRWVSLHRQRRVSFTLQPTNKQVLLDKRRYSDARQQGRLDFQRLISKTRLARRHDRQGAAVVAV